MPEALLGKQIYSVRDVKKDWADLKPAIAFTTQTLASFEADCAPSTAIRRIKMRALSIVAGVALGLIAASPASAGGYYGGYYYGYCPWIPWWSGLP